MRISATTIHAALGATLCAASLGLAQPSASQSISLLGTVQQASASNEPLLAPNSRTAIVTVNTMYSGQEFAGNLAGSQITVVLTPSAPALAVGSQAVFSGEPIIIGTALTMADSSETPQGGMAGAVAAAPSPQVMKGLEARRLEPLRRRLEVADVVVVGTVQSVRPLEPQEKGRPPGSEHDPDWQIASLSVRSGLRGAKAGDVISVLFPASTDIEWFAVHKLKAGETDLVLAHRPTPRELLTIRTPASRDLMAKTGALVVTAPNDVLPPSRLKDVETLIQTQGAAK